MPIAAVPSYLGEDFSEMPPGHRFGPFFPVWEKRDWSLPKDGAKTEALKAVLNYPNCKAQIEALKSRQKALADALGSDLLTLPAKSIAPFVTGTGMEHPLENGFAFLNPYGLPYLPGSSVKGLLRQCARLLVEGELDDDRGGWDETAIEAMFGRDTQSDEGRRGALIFWDVLIAAKDCKLGIDVLTPHYGAYYRGEETPHDSGSLNPVPFLVVPPAADFTFHIQCRQALLSDPALRASWQAMVQLLLEQSFDWLGFGAKTAGGYGQLLPDASALRALQESTEAQKRAAMSPVDQAIIAIDAEWGQAKKYDHRQPGGPLDNIIGERIKAATDWEEQDRRRLYDHCKSALQWLGKNKKAMKKKLAPLNIAG